MFYVWLLQVRLICLLLSQVPEQLQNKKQKNGVTTSTMLHFRIDYLATTTKAFFGALSVCYKCFQVEKPEENSTLFLI